MAAVEEQRSSFCAAALEEALLRFGKPRIFNTNQGSTFTAEAFAGKLAAAGVVIRWTDAAASWTNFIERVWRSISMKRCISKLTPRPRGAGRHCSWMTLNNSRRPYQAMNNQTPMAVWRAGMDKIEAAARAVDMPLRLDNETRCPHTHSRGRSSKKRLDS